MHDVVPGLVHELTWLLLQLTYWPHPDGYGLLVPGILPEGADGGLPSLVQLLVKEVGVVPSREMMNPVQ